MFKKSVDHTKRPVFQYNHSAREVPGKGFSMRNLFGNRKRRGAISTEYVIVLVLIAVGGILAFMLLGQQLKEQTAQSLDKIGGTKETDKKAGVVAPDQLRTDLTDMGQAAGGAAEADVPVTAAE